MNYFRPLLPYFLVLLVLLSTSIFLEIGLINLHVPRDAGEIIARGFPAKNYSLALPHWMVVQQTPQHREFLDLEC